MSTQTEQTVTLKTLLPYVLDTRWYGVTYIHAWIRRSIHGWQGVTEVIDGKEVKATFRGFGRSLENGGHKYKAYANFSDGKPVPTKVLRTMMSR